MTEKSFVDIALCYNCKCFSYQDANKGTCSERAHNDSVRIFQSCLLFDKKTDYSREQIIELVNSNILQKKADKANIPEIREKIVFIQIAAGNPVAKRRKVTELMANEIETSEKIYTTRNEKSSEMWIYCDGIYIPHARTYITEFCRKILLEAFTSTIANEVISKVEADTYIGEDDFFSEHDDYFLIPVRNGILNLQTRELIPFSPAYRFFTKLPVTFVPESDCPEIKNFFKVILVEQDLVDTMQEMFGYLPVKKNFIEKIFFFLGNGRNGKSKTLELMKYFLGVENCANVQLDDIQQNDFAIATLHKKLANLSGDISKRGLKETNRIKALSGGDLLQGNRKFLTPIKFVNYAKLIYSANELPRTYDTSLAFFERPVLIEFKQTFLPQNEIDKLSKEERKDVKLADPNIVLKLTTEQELSGLLNWALDGLQRLIKNRNFTYARTSNEIMKLWYRKSDSLTAFIEECVSESMNSWVPKSEFRRVYKEYCKKFKLKKDSDIFIGKMLEKERLLAETKQKEWNGSMVHVWYGIQINNAILKEMLGNDFIVEQSSDAEQRGDYITKYVSSRDILTIKQEILTFLKDNPLPSTLEISTSIKEDSDLILPVLEQLAKEGSIFSPKPDKWRLLE